MTCKDSNFWREKAEELQKMLEEERAKPSVQALMAVAESSARIVESMAGVNSQTELAYQARMMARNALRQVRERAQEGGPR